MASDDTKVIRTTRSAAERALTDGDRSPGGELEATGAEVELALDDLVGDDQGEVVVFNDSGFRNLAIRTDRAVVADGYAGAHVTASGSDVSGFRFVRFDNGLTLYFEPGLDLILAPAGAAPPP